MRVSDDQLRSALSEVDYPIGKEDLIAHVRARSQDDAVLKALRSLPPVDYGNTAEVIRSVGVDVADEPPADVAAQRARMGQSSPVAADQRAVDRPSSVTRDVEEREP